MVHEIAPTVAFRGTQWGFWWRAWLSLYGTLRGRRGSLDVVREIASTGLFCVTDAAFRVTLWDFLRHACLSLYGTLRGRRGSGCGARDSLYRPLLRDTRSVSCHSMGLLAACVAIIVWHFAWQAWRFEGIICTR